MLLLTLFSTLLLAGGTPLVLKSYVTNEEIDTDHIAHYSSKFKIEVELSDDDVFETLIDSEDLSSLKQNTIHKFNWIMLELDENISNGNYWMEYTAFNFTEHTFTSHQSVEKFSLLGRKFFSFTYDKTQDSRRYFFKLVTAQSHVIPVASLYTPQTFSIWINRYSIQMLISFFLFGLIFMTAIYNGALYIYNREKSFLYYMLMQLFMIGILVYQTDMIEVYVMGDAENEEIALFFYFVFVQCGILFVLFFIRSFLETKKYLPSHDRVLHYITLVAIVDLILFFVPIMMILRLYAFIILYFLWLAWLRLKQGYKPAFFFLFRLDCFDVRCFYFRLFL